jgi:hypothetical protein
VGAIRRAIKRQSFNAPGGMVYVEPDVLLNLLSNAGKFTERGTVSLEVTRAPSGGAIRQKEGPRGVRCLVP